jgi:predicted nucleic acid-binding protein
LNYLAQIGATAVLPQLFDKLLVPSAVYRELSNPAAPAAVRSFAATPVDWLDVRPDPETIQIPTGRIDVGERAAIGLAILVRADFLLMDDRVAVALARRLGLVVTGTLGVLNLAAERGFIVFCWRSNACNRRIFATRRP